MWEGTDNTEFQLGCAVPEKGGIFVAKWEVQDLHGMDLGYVFNVFAHFRDLTPDPATFDKNIASINDARALDGFDGFKFEYDPDTPLSTVITSGKYLANPGWLIPPCEVLYGRFWAGKGMDASDYVHVMIPNRQNMFALQKIGDFATHGFKPYHYLSSTRYPTDPRSICSIDFTDGLETGTDNGPGLVRPVRMELVSAKGQRPGL